MGRRYIKIILPVLLLIPLICICIREESNSYVISHYFGSNEDAEKYVRTLNDEKIFDKVFMNDTPRIEIVATEKQAKKWVEKKKADIKKCMKGIDPNAFMILMDSHEIRGEGFLDYSHDEL